MGQPHPVSCSPSPFVPTRPTWTKRLSSAVLELAHLNSADGVVRALDQDEVRPLACRQDVLSAVWAVDRVPDLSIQLLGRLLRKRRRPAEVGCWFLQRGGPYQEKALDVPTP